MTTICLSTKSDAKRNDVTIHHNNLYFLQNIKERTEEISFYKEDNVVIYKEEDGSFQAQDFNKVRTEKLIGIDSN